MLGTFAHSLHISSKFLEVHTGGNGFVRVCAREGEDLSKVRTGYYPGPFWRFKLSCPAVQRYLSIFFCALPCRHKMSDDMNNAPIQGYILKMEGMCI